MAYTGKYASKTPWKQRWKHTDEDLIASAAPFKHVKDWKDAKPAHYNAAWRRGLLDKCCAHMTPKAHPYSGSYVVYAFEFADNHAYVGHTFKEKLRKGQHMQSGPVLRHLAVCHDYTYKILEKDIKSPAESAEAEERWQARYREQGWIPLWSAKAGGLGTIQVVKWVKDAVMAEAKKHKTRQEWIDKSQMSYRVAKRNGWFEEASAHMPKRVLGVGAGVAKSAEAREAMRQAKLGRKQDPAAVAARLEATRATLKARHAVTIERLKDDPALFTTPIPALAARHGMSQPTLRKFMKVIRAEQE